MKLCSVALAVALGLTASAASAAYTRASSGPVNIDTIYANEWGSPFVTFKTQINTVCAGGNGNGLYLYNIELGFNPQLQGNKMAILLTAKIAGKRVVLDYFYDGTAVPGSNWANCYIHGIQMVDQ